MKITGLSSLLFCILLIVSVHCGLRIKNMRLIDELDR
jgi:hypothetical protein